MAFLQNSSTYTGRTAGPVYINVDRLHPIRNICQLGLFSKYWWQKKATYSSTFTFGISTAQSQCGTDTVADGVFGTSLSMNTSHTHTCVHCSPIQLTF